MGRNRIEFPFTPGGSNTFTGNVIINGSLTTNDGVTFNNGFSTTSFVVTGAGPSQWLNGTVEQYLAGSNVQVFAGSTWQFNNTPTFGGGLKITGGTPAADSIYDDAVGGFVIQASVGTGTDFTIRNPTASTSYMFVSTGSSVPSFPHGVVITGTAGANPGGITKELAGGLTLEAVTGSSYDLTLRNPSNSASYMDVPTGSNTPDFPNGMTIEGGSLLGRFQYASFVPTPVGFTIVNGTGSVTFSGQYLRIGNFCHYEIQATLTGTATLAAVGGTSHFTGLPVTSLSPTVANHVTDGSGTNYGHGWTQGTIHNSPTIGATNGAGSITWNGDLLTT